MLLVDRHWRAVPLILALVCLTCGEPERRDTSSAVTEPDRQLKQQWDAWYKRQVAQDCPTGPYDGLAIEAVRRAHAGDKRQFVYGLRDPYNRRAASLENLKTRPNPRGEGVMVTAWEDRNRQGTADYSRRRSVWLILDAKVYPIDTNASGDIGRLYDGLPAPVQKRAGLTDSYERGRTLLDQLGIEDETFERRFDGGNPFPMCQ